MIEIRPQIRPNLEGGKSSPGEHPTSHYRPGYEERNLSRGGVKRKNAGDSEVPLVRPVYGDFQVIMAL